MAGQRSFSEFLALRRNTSLLLLTLVLAGTGERLWLGFAPKYLETLGAGVFIIGLFDALQTWLGAVYAYPGGWLTDRWGHRRSLLFFAGLSVAGYAVVLFWRHWLALLLGAFLFLAWSALSLPATFTLIATNLKVRQYTMGVGIQSMVRRVPMMLGPLLGGWLVTRYGWEYGIQLALAGCILLGLLAATVITFLTASETERISGREPEAPCPYPGSAVMHEKQPGFTDVVRSFSPALHELLVSDILIRFCERIPYAFVILWAMNHGGVNAQQFGVLVAIEMVTAMLCYIPVAHLADKYGRRPFVLATFVFFTLFPISLLWAHSFGWLAVAFAMRGLK